MHRYDVHAEDLVGFTMALDVVESVGYAGRGIVYNTALARLTQTDVAGSGGRLLF